MQISRKERQGILKARKGFSNQRQGTVQRGPTLANSGLCGLALAQRSLRETRTFLKLPRIKPLIPDPDSQRQRPMKKIDILNFITNYRTAPNDVKTYSQLISHLGTSNEEAMKSLLAELQQNKVVREVEQNGEKAYQVIAK